jgi:hypothetical protein
MITRRTFLQIAGVCGTSIAAGAVMWNDSLRSLSVRAARRLDGFIRSPEARLRAHFDYLNIDLAGVSQFFSEYERTRPNFSRRSPLPQDVYTRFLLSTDFFQRGAQESRLVRYVLFYDPGLTPCYNPLARFDDGSESDTGLRPDRVSRGVVERRAAATG